MTSIEKNGVAASLGDQSADHGDSVVDDRRLMGVGDAGELAVANVDDDVLFELIEPAPGTATRYHQLLQRGTRQRRKRELDADVDRVLRNLLVAHQTFLPIKLSPADLRSIAEKTVMENWRPAPRPGAR